MNTVVELSVLPECEEALAALEKLKTLVQSGKSSKAAIKEAEHVVNLTSRALYCRFVDNVLWGGLKKATYKIVVYVLRSAVKFVKLDGDCIQSVSGRLLDFNGFVEHHPPSPEQLVRRN